jgi:hypothetical protein
MKAGKLIEFYSLSLNFLVYRSIFSVFIFSIYFQNLNFLNCNRPVFSKLKKTDRLSLIL